MLQLLLAAALLGADAQAVEPPPLGSVIVLTGGAKLVAAATGADVSHVALVLPGDAGALVYEATPDQVRSCTWPEFLNEIAELNARRRVRRRIEVAVMAPRRPFSEGELDAAQEFAAGQIGRRYSVRGYVRGDPGEGIHCAEFAATALQRTGRCYFPSPHELAPQAMIDEISDSYAPPTQVALRPPSDNLGWCDQQRKVWGGRLDWSLWAASEAWSWCW